MRRVSVDIGGTFTDCFLVYDGEYIEAKVGNSKTALTVSLGSDNFLSTLTFLPENGLSTTISSFAPHTDFL